MNKLHIFSILFCLSAVFCFAQAPDTLWTRTFGGNGSDVAYSMQQTSDGGFIIAGRTNSYGAGGYDVYLIKTDADGDTIWTRTYGGAVNDYSRSVQQTTDGGYIVAGYTMESNPMTKDILLIKTDANGDTLWTRVYERNVEEESAYGVRQTSDGGYIIAGTYFATSGPAVIYGYLIKTDANGDTLWTRIQNPLLPPGCICYLSGGVRQTNDGGYIAAGTVATSNNWDFYLMKTDSLGDTLWTRHYDREYEDINFGLELTPDGGYILVGRAESNVTKICDVYLVKTDSNGDTLWTRTYGNDGTAVGYGIKPTADGGYIVAASIVGFGLVREEAFMLKIDANGDSLWSLMLGGTSNDEAVDVVQTQDGGYLFTGKTGSFGAGGTDAWLIRLGAQASPISLTLTPHNPPIRVNAGGGSFTYDAVIENVTANPVNFEAWTEVILPNGNIHGPLLQRGNLVIPPGAVISRQLTQTVPGIAPSGNYTYIGNIGFYPDSVMDTDNFPFEKRAGYDGASYIQSWEIIGWDDDEEGFRIQGSGFRFLSVNPNPFNASTALSFKLHTAGNVKLAIYDISGREAARLAEGYHPAGTYQIEWDASKMASGVYFARLIVEGINSTQKLLLIK